MTEKLFLTTVSGKKSEQTPIWIMRQAGRYLTEYRAIRALQKDFISLCLNPKQASAVTIQPITRFGFDAAIRNTSNPSNIITKTRSSSSQGRIRSQDPANSSTSQRRAGQHEKRGPSGS